jgi:predicted  nucleic acid-binding Zn-ribbon protein
MDDFCTMLDVLNRKLQEKNEEVSSLRDRFADLDDKLIDKGAEICRLKDDKQRLQDEVITLRNRCGDYNANETDNRWYRDQYNRLTAELAAYREKDPEIPTKANEFMQKIGIGLMRQGLKIQCIKEVRSITHWGLKETKDYVEDYMKGLPPQTIGDLIKEKLGEVKHA